MANVCLWPRVPNGLEDVSKYPALFSKLLDDQSWSMEDLKKLAGLNFLRVLKKVEEVQIFFFDCANLRNSTEKDQLLR